MPGITTSTATQAAAPKAIPSTSERSRAVRLVALAAAPSAALAYLAIGLAALWSAQPPDDACALFASVERAAAGLAPFEDGFAWRVGWRALVAATAATGADVALAALAWNALGAGVVAGLCAQAVARSTARGPAAVALAALALAAPLAGGAPLADLGTGAMLHGSLALSALALLLWSEGRGVVWLPLFAAALASLRDDGAVLALGLTLLGAAESRRRGGARRYLAASAVAAAAVLAWRASAGGRFALALPAPLDPATPRALGAAILLCAFAVGRGGGEGARRFVLGLLPFLALLAAAALANAPAQAAAPARSPIDLALVFGLFWWSARALEARPRLGPAVPVLAALALFPGVRAGLRASAAELAARGYLDAFAPELGARLPREVVIATVSTAPGRLAFWTAARVEHLGDPASPERVAALDPDVLVAAAPTSWMRARLADDGPAAAAVDGGRLAVAVPELARFLELAEGSHDLFAVDAGEGFDHVWAVRRALPASREIASALEAAAASAGGRSYASLRGLPLSDGVDRAR